MEKRIPICLFFFVFCLSAFEIGVWATDNLPILTIQPAPDFEYLFGVVELGQTAEKEMRIINTGQGILSGSVNLEKPTSSEGKEEEVFFISGDINFSLLANQSAIIKIRFVPQKEKEYQGKIKVFASENQNAEITLKGTGKKAQKSYYLFGCGEIDSKTDIYSKYADGIFVLMTFLLLLMGRRVNRSNDV